MLEFLMLTKTQPPSTWPTGTINSCRKVCACTCDENTPPQTMAEPTLWSFDDRRLKRLFGCRGWKWPPDWRINIITQDKNTSAHSSTHTPHFKWTLKSRIWLLPHSLIIWNTVASYAVKKRRWKTEEEMELKASGRLDLLRGDQLTQIFLKMLKEDKPLAVQPVITVWDAARAVCVTKTPRQGCCRKAGLQARRWHSPTGPSLSQLYGIMKRAWQSLSHGWHIKEAKDESSGQKRIIPQVAIMEFNYSSSQAHCGHAFVTACTYSKMAQGEIYAK